MDSLGIRKECYTAPKISIIMTTYNAEEHLQASIRSALAQDINSLEVLCVDGHSSDNTIKIINHFIEEDARVRLIFQDRPGIGAAKNCGIENANGEFITFLDADDFYVDPTALRKMYDACKNEGVRVCGAFRSTLFMDGTVENELLHRNDCKPNMKSVCLRYHERPYDYHFHSYIYDRKMIINSDARFAEVRAYDDTHFYIRAMLQAEVFCVVPVELYRYRCGPAYDWGMERANDAISALIDQLILTRKEKIAALHWLTVQRINYEYGDIFEKNVLAGDVLLMERLIRANMEIDPNLIQQVEDNQPSEKWYLTPMIHRKYEDMPLRTCQSPFAPKYLLEPLWKLIYANNSVFVTDLELSKANIRIKELEEKIQKYEQRRGARVRKKIRAGLRCLQEHGVKYTIGRTFYKIKKRLRRGKYDE